MPYGDENNFLCEECAALVEKTTDVSLTKTDQEALGWAKIIENETPKGKQRTGYPKGGREKFRGNTKERNNQITR